METAKTTKTKNQAPPFMVLLQPYYYPGQWFLCQGTVVFKGDWSFSHSLEVFMAKGIFGSWWKTSRGFSRFPALKIMMKFLLQISDSLANMAVVVICFCQNSLSSFGGVWTPCFSKKWMDSLRKKLCGRGRLKISIPSDLCLEGSNFWLKLGTS